MKLFLIMKTWLYKLARVSRYFTLGNHVFNQNCNIPGPERTGRVSPAIQVGVHQFVSLAGRLVVVQLVLVVGVSLGTAEGRGRWRGGKIPPVRLPIHPTQGAP